MLRLYFFIFLVFCIYESYGEQIGYEPYQYIEHATYHGSPSCEGLPVGMISGTKHNRCRYIGGSRLHTTCDSWNGGVETTTTPLISVYTYDASDTTCSSSKPTTKYQYKEGCQRISDTSSIQTSCKSSLNPNPFSIYGPGVLITYSEVLEACSDSPTEADSWTFLPIGKCMKSPYVGGGSQIITSCTVKEDDNGVSVNVYDVITFDKEGCVESDLISTISHTIGECELELDGHYKRHICIQ